MNEKKYCIGLRGKTVLRCNNSEIYIYISTDDMEIMLICDKNEKIMKMQTKKDSDEDYVKLNKEMIEYNVIKYLSEDGSRWEGDWLNEKPFGFGSLFDSEGNRTYSGFMFEGKKIGFGPEFFSDNHKVDYC